MELNDRSRDELILDVWSALSLMAGILTRERQGTLETCRHRGEGPVTTEAGMIGVMSLQAKELLAATRSWESHRKDSPRGSAALLAPWFLISGPQNCDTIYF